MKTLIFGCGYLGRRVATAWIDAGIEVFAVTRSETNAEAFRQSGIQPIIADICDLNSLRDLPAVDVVLHSIGFDRNSTQSQEEVTIGGMKNILSMIEGRCQRFIYVSSTSVYGQSSGELIDEDSECHPTQSGGQLCLKAEGLVRNHQSSFPTMKTNILRLAGIYGPDRLLSRIDALRAGNALTGRGDAWLNLIHVDDAVTAVLACEQLTSLSETFIVVDDQPIPRAEYFSLLAELVGAPVPTFDPNQPRRAGFRRPQQTLHESKAERIASMEARVPDDCNRIASFD